MITVYLLFGFAYWIALVQDRYDDNKVTAKSMFELDGIVDATVTMLIAMIGITVGWPLILLLLLINAYRKPRKDKR